MYTGVVDCCMCVSSVVMYCSLTGLSGYLLFCFVFFQAEDGIRDLVRSRGLGDVYKRQCFVGLI